MPCLYTPILGLGIKTTGVVEQRTNKMTNKFKNKYRIPSARLQSWDYGRNGVYFLTVCTYGKKHYFGEIVGGKMQLSHAGVLADVLWYEIKNHAKNVDLGAFVVMPNHVHGILFLKGRDKQNFNDNPEDSCRDKACLVSTMPIVSTVPIVSTMPLEKIGRQRFQNQGKNTVSSIIGSYKSAVSRHANRLGYEFSWQSRFYDHIIRNDKSFQQIKDYVKTNPQCWEKDKFHPGNIDKE